MKIKFTKYHGTGNDFIIIDNRENQVNLTTQQISSLCNRRFGIGADGLILLENDETSQFYMRYYNSDGSSNTMCGNGGRCIAHFAAKLGLGYDLTFRAADGKHKASVVGDYVKLKAADVYTFEKHATHYYIDSGSPHHVIFMSNVDLIDVNKEGAIIRNNYPYKEKGVNVNFAHFIDSSTIKVRTYERGVEAETYSCGTGSIAAAIAAYDEHTIIDQHVTVKTNGGDLIVDFEADGNHNYKNVYLSGSATKVYDAEIEI